MRIITGKYKGRILKTPRTMEVRPAMDYVRGVIFNVLQNHLRLNGARVLDLFAGTGSLGLEAISRGAWLAVFVDNNGSILSSITENAIALGCAESCQIVQADALSYIQNLQENFDLIFADPPYVFEQTSEIPRLIFERRLLKRKGYLIIEHSRHTTFPPLQQYKMVIEKELGNTRLSFFVHPS